MAEQQEEKAEDLSGLKGPIRGLGWHVIVAALVVVVCGTAAIAQPWFWPPLVAATLVFAVACGLYYYLWLTRNYSGHTLWWWKDADGKWRVTAKGYPTQATGLVIEVHVRARPKVRLLWGAEAWEYSGARPDQNPHFRNTQGAVLYPYQPYQGGALAGVGLTAEVAYLLASMEDCWKIMPLDAGRVLRFEDWRGMGIEVGYREKTVDLQEILRHGSCGSYRASQRQGVGVLQQQREEVEHQLELADQELEKERDFLVVLFKFLRSQKQASRSRSDVFTKQMIHAIVKYLHDRLPPDHKFRTSHHINAEEVRALAKWLNEHAAQQVKPTTSPLTPPSAA